MSCSNSNPIKKIFQKTKKVQKKNEEEEFAIHNKKSTFAWQNEALKNYQKQKNVPNPSLNEQLNQNQDEDTQSQKSVKFNINSMKESIVNEAQQNINKFKSMFKIDDSGSKKNDQIQTKSKIPLKVQEQILQKQILEQQKISISKPSSQTKIAFEEEIPSSISSFSSNVTPKIRKELSVDEIQRSVTNDYTSLSSQPKQRSSFNIFKCDNKNPLIKHLESISLPNTIQRKSQQISSLNSLTENSNKNDYFSQERNRRLPQLQQLEDLKSQNQIQQHENQLQDDIQLRIKQNQDLEKQNEQIKNLKKEKLLKSRKSVQIKEDVEIIDSPSPSQFKKNLISYQFRGGDDDDYNMNEKEQTHENLIEDQSENSCKDDYDDEYSEEEESEGSSDEEDNETNNQFIKKREISSPYNRREQYRYEYETEISKEQRNQLETENDQEIFEEQKLNQFQQQIRQRLEDDHDQVIQQQQYSNMSFEERVKTNEESFIEKDSQSMEEQQSQSLKQINIQSPLSSSHISSLNQSPKHTLNNIQFYDNQNYQQQDNQDRLFSHQVLNENNRKASFTSSPISVASQVIKLGFEDKIKDVEIQQDLRQNKREFASIGDRSRKRTEKKIRQKKKKQQQLFDEGIVDRKHIDSYKLPVQPRMRSMKDIQNGSMRTSYALSKRSFKWSAKAKSIMSSGKSSFKLSGQSIDDENDFDISLEDRYYDKQQKNGLNSSDESMDLEDKVEDLLGQSPRIAKSDSQSQKITEQKGKQYKKRQMQKMLLNSQNQQKNFESQINGWRALESFYMQLSKNNNHSEITQSVETFGEAMTLFIDNQKNFSHIISRDSFVYHTNVGEGSFGQVDLYFFKQQSQSRHQSISDSLVSQETWHTMNSTIKNQLPNLPHQSSLLFSMNQSNESTPLNFAMGSINQSQQNNFIFENNFKQQKIQNEAFNSMSQSKEYQKSPLTQVLYSQKLQQENQQLNLDNQNQFIEKQCITQDDKLLQNQSEQQNNQINQQKYLQQNQDIQQQQTFIQKQQSIEYFVPQQNQTKNLDFQYLPVACKKIENLEEFTREFYIMQTVKCEYMPKLIFQDLEKQLLFMELGLCSLEDLKNDSEDDYTFTDEFTYQILVNLIKAVESLLSNVNSETDTPQPLFHSDIKPSNVMLTVKKYKNQQNCSIKLLLIDYGGASFALEDYWSFYTPAFVSTKLWQKLVNISVNGECLTWQEVRYAEVYAACRSVQYLIVPDEEKEYFKKENYELFLNAYSHLYPKTCYILKQVYNKGNIGQINDIYDGILSSSEKTLYTGLNPQNIPFESKKIFELSKFYNYFSEKKESPTESIEKEEVTQEPYFEKIQLETQVY